ncbi:hypothetical protein GCM10009802_14460 [Streptomyces synnematoformans]|uniref:Uncharacterized protein n=2 Tax=Streptomyces synnematoformans TaxID=415721 RepID=A0ABN2XN71_9ACTN
MDVVAAVEGPDGGIPLHGDPAAGPRWRAAREAAALARRRLTELFGYGPAGPGGRRFRAACRRARNRARRRTDRDAVSPPAPPRTRAPLTPSPGFT